MPRPGPRRPLVAVRMDDETVAALDRVAERNAMTRSDIVRAAIAEFLARA